MDDAVHSVLGAREVEFETLAGELVAAGLAANIGAARDMLRDMARRSRLAGRLINADTPNQQLLITRWHVEGG